MEDNVTRRSAVARLLGASAGSWLSQAKARAIGAAPSNKEPDDIGGFETVFVDIPLSSLEGIINQGIIFTVVSTTTGVADVRQKTKNGSNLLYQFFIKAGLTHSSGSSKIGFLNETAGSVARTAEAKMRDFASAADFGAKGDGKTDNAEAFLRIKAAVETGMPVHFSRGIYCSSIGLLLQSPGCIRADQNTRIKIIAKSDYVVRFDYDGDVSFFDHTGYCENLILDGNGFAIDGLSLIGVISARFDNICSTNVGRAGLHMHWAQLCLFNNYICSGNIEAFHTRPLHGILVDEASSAANTFINATIEGTGGDGVSGKGMVNTVFINGCSQGCVGAGIRLGETPALTLSCTGNTILGMDLEANAGGDIVLEASSSANDFISVKSGFATPSPAIRINSGASRNCFYGGVSGHIYIDYGAVDTTINHISLLGIGSGLTNYGLRTKWMQLRNISDNSIIFDSANASQKEIHLTDKSTYAVDAQFYCYHFIYSEGPELSISNPDNAQSGQELNFTIFNVGAVQLNIKWDNKFRSDGFISPGGHMNRTYSFVYNGNFDRWYLTRMSLTDISN